MAQIGVIQILRAVAALMIVFSHAQNDCLNEAIKAHGTFARSDILPWDAGVDLFFVISGFIMVHASRRWFATPRAGSLFICRRLIRIVPLYWLITAIMLAILGYAAWTGKRPFPSFAEISASLGFVPFARPEDGQPRPIVALGWTLNYEMFFYVVFALFIRFQRFVAVAAITLTLALAVAAGSILHPSATILAYWSDPIVLEFGFGMLTALVWQSGVRCKGRLIFLLVMLGAAMLALDLDGMRSVGPLDVDANGFTRVLGAGIPMALIFAAIVLADPAFSTGSRLASFFTLLGDASYALYLFHPLAVIFARKAYLALGWEKTVGYWPLIAADLALAAGLALVIHICIEKPISTTLHNWFFDKRPQPDPKTHVVEVRQG